MTHKICLNVGLTSLAASCLLALPLWAQSGKFRDVTGLWEGNYKAAFSKNHPVYPDQSRETQVELDVYRQEDNLIWVVKRWRRDGGDWNEEYGVGSFNIDDRDELVIVEESPPPKDWVNTGMLIGEYDDGELHLVYAGPRSGVSYGVSLRRKR